MTRISLLFSFAAVALSQTGSVVPMPIDGLSGSVVPGNSRVIMGGTGTLESGVTVRCKSVLSWTGGTSRDSGRGLGAGGIAMEPDTIHRLMTDKLKRAYFGYDLVIEQAHADNGYLATFQPPTHLEGLLARLHGGETMTLMPPPKYPAPQIVHDGDIIELELMASPDGKQKLTDYIQILAHDPEPSPAKTTAEPRDFTVDDGPVKFDESRFTIWEQGQLFKEGGFEPFWTPRPNRIAGSYSWHQGATFWVAFPGQGQGRYVLSLIPHEGFSKAGTIRDNVISFEDEGRQYEIRFMSPIAGAGKAWNIYMMHDPTFEPERERTSVDMGTDRLDNLLPAH